MDADQFAERFKRLRSWEDRYRYLIQMGRKLAPFPEEDRSEENLVPGCMSRVWLIPHVPSGESETLSFLADSDADIEGLFEKMELAQHLSANRRNGFYSMNQKMREYAARRLAEAE